MDFASDIAVYWNSLHGKLLYFPFLEENIFGVHLYLILFLILPIYAFFQHPITLLFLQTLFLGLAAYPLYLLARLKLNKPFALGIGIAYLLYPSLGFINLFETHFDSFVILFTFFALYYFESGKFNRFLIFTLLALACKENASLFIFMFGVYAFLRKKSKRWIYVPLILGGAWFFLAIKLIIPHFAKQAGLYPGGFVWSVLYGHLGKNPLEMIKTILMHPIAVAKFAFLPRKVLYLLVLFMPLGFVSLFSPAPLLIALPIFMQNLLSLNFNQTQIRYQYVAMLIPFIFFSAILTLEKLLKNKTIFPERNKLLVCLILFPLIAGVSLKAPQLYLLNYIKNYKISDWARQKDKFIQVIPKDARVIATFQFLPKLAHRHNLYSMHFVSSGATFFSDAKYETPHNLEYALIDFNEPLMINYFYPPQAPKNMRNFLEEGDWRVYRAADDVILFENNSKNENKLCEFIAGSKIQNFIQANIYNKIIFLGYDIKNNDVKPEGIMHLVYYWKRIGLINRPVVFFVDFLDSNNNVVLQKVHFPGYRVYLPSSWPEGQIFKENNYIFIPPVLKKGIYNLRAGLFYLDTGEDLPVSGKSKLDSLGRIILGDIVIN
jgi:uncharacterized membrane protein